MKDKCKKKKIKKPVMRGCAKVPVIMQMEALECGAAALAMVMAYYDKWVPLEQVRSDCGVSRDGSNALNLLKAARNYGFEAKGYKYEPEELKKYGTFPCIIHWNFNHFVVLNGFRGDRAMLNDPANGEYSVSMDMFDKSFTGICLRIVPGESFKPSGKPKSIWGFAGKRLRGARAAVVFVAVVAFFMSLLKLANPMFTRVFMDRLLTKDQPEWLVPFIAVLSGFTLLQIIVTWIYEVGRLRINGKFAIEGSSSYMWHVLHLPMEFFSQRMSGDIQQRQEVNREIANTLVETFAPLVLDIVMMVFYMVIMMRYSLLLTVVGISAILINLFMSGIISRKRINITRVQMRDSGKLASATVNVIDMIETVKASGSENGYFEKWSGYQASVNTQNVKYSRLNQYLGVIPELISALAEVLVLMLGVYLIIQGEFTAGMLLAFQGFMLSFTEPASKLIKAGQTIQEMRTDMERVEDVMEYAEDEVHNKSKEATRLEKLSGAIEIKNVSFGYSKLAEPAIVDFNLSLKQGNRIALVGASGCGKSTIAKLISGLYKPWSGAITFDGRTIEEIDRNVFTGSLVVVDQDITLFEGTVADNIKMWDESIEDFEMIMGARDAQLHSDIMHRDGGYLYKIKEGGKDFSGGQRQRMEIARVLAQDPTIVILDEATSALDAKTEQEVVKAIMDRGITCIIIAHRLSTIRDCDEIIVMDDGKIAERGTHDELFAKDGIYTRLVSNE